MKKETIIIIIAIFVTLGGFALLMNKNNSLKNEAYLNQNTQVPVVTPKPTAVPTLAININKKENMKKQYDSAPTMAIDANKKYQATFTTSAGEIVVELYADQVPNTVNNFVFLANEKFYDNTRR